MSNTNQDWQAILSSEIFKEYMAGELKKEANESMENLMLQIKQLENKIKNNPALKHAFQTFQKEAKETHLVEAFSLLNLEDDNDI